MLVFVEGGKPENPEKNPRSRDENQQQTQPTYDAESGNRTRATMVGGECSHHCAIPAPTVMVITNAAPACRLLVAGWNLLLKNDIVMKSHNNGKLFCHTMTDFILYL